MTDWNTQQVGTQQQTDAILTKREIFFKDILCALLSSAPNGIASDYIKAAADLTDLAFIKLEQYNNQS